MKFKKSKNSNYIIELADKPDFSLPIMPDSIDICLKAVVEIRGSSTNVWVTPPLSIKCSMDAFEMVENANLDPENQEVADSYGLTLKELWREFLDDEGFAEIVQAEWGVNIDNMELSE